MHGLLAWMLPESAWWPLTRLLGRMNVATHPTRTKRQTAQITTLLAGTGAASDPHGVAVENWANDYEERFQYMRAWRPGGWTPKIDVVGSDHVCAALSRGRGTILWGGNFSFNALVGKMAMHRLGLAVSHFSRPGHGFSKTPFGVRYINALARRVEDSYLANRLMVPEDETRIALQRMRDCLKNNSVVSFTVGTKGRRTTSAAFLGGRITLATGPLAMASATGAALLPVHTLRVAPGHFEVTVGESLTASGSNTEGNCEAAAQAYADALAPLVRRDPGQWRGWSLAHSPGTGA